MLLGIIFAIIVAIFWSVGEIENSRLSRNVDRTNIYFYQYLVRAIIYLGVVLIFNIELFTKFNFDDFFVFLPIIMCDLIASYVVIISLINGKLSIVSPIMAAYPIVDILLGIFFLKEKAGVVEIILSIIIAVSIIVLAMSQKKSRRSPHPIKGIIFAVIYMLLISFSIFFEKNAYLENYSIYDFYFYKGIVYLLTSGFFMLIIGITPVRIKKPNTLILKGTGITPIGNVLNSFSLSFANMIIVTPVSSMYSVLTNFLSRKVLKEKISLIESICISLILLCTITLIIMGII